MQQPMWDDDGSGRTLGPNPLFMREVMEEENFSTKKSAMEHFMRVYQGKVNPHEVYQCVKEWFDEANRAEITPDH